MRAGALGTATLDGSWVYVKAAADAGPPLQMAGNTLHGGREKVAVAIDSGDITVGGTPVRQAGKAWSQLNPVVP